jgi:hypothetical protein
VKEPGKYNLVAYTQEEEKPDLLNPVSLPYLQIYYTSFGQAVKK